MWKLLVCVTVLFVTDVVVCKPDYLFNREVNGWLKLNAVPATFQQAFLNCHYEGAVLASPINVELATALRNIRNQSELDSPIFLGVNAVFQLDFMSIEGVSLADLSITWGTYSNRKTSEDCLSLATNGKAYISSCTLLLPYICYKKRDNTTILNRCGTFDDDYHYYRSTGSCYKKHNKKQTWKKGYQICVAEGGYLVIINDKQEADIVKGLLDPPSAGKLLGEPTHIGLQDYDKDYTWLSVHGEKIEDLFNIWGEGQPDHRGEDLCGFLWAKGTLDDVYCNNPVVKFSFVCEKDPTTLRFENISEENCM